MLCFADQNDELNTLDCVLTWVSRIILRSFPDFFEKYQTKRKVDKIIESSNVPDSISRASYGNSLTSVALKYSHI